MNTTSSDPTQHTALITGANSGLGKAIAMELARRGMTLVLVCRSLTRGEQARWEIRAETGNEDIHLITGDLAEQSDVRRVAAQFNRDFKALHLLINNAGSAFPERRLTHDGIEKALAINHVAPFLLTRLLLPRLKSSAPARIINVGTRFNTAMDLDDLNWEKRRYRMMQAYGQSKLGMLHSTFELARQLEGSGVTVNCVFPGVFMSNLGGTDGAQNAFWRAVARWLGWAIPTANQAAQSVIHYATAPEMANLNGQYVSRKGPVKAPEQARAPEMNRRVWEATEALIKAS
ncbi:SDR family NAD(P)-dependent oxidoreductase [Ectothiorhodospira marina]|uniref:Short-chain dehydrogenase n=1 Tax=Ectothiorhodospira marina TaxID=1396821 RepID=A0A1H7PCQ6_9GAMM|nr:SDR family NAD(P)-dependent oxidoreductase [Ectothiorhodospira marina]SEL32847.1 Short-chain dehydrogenase [Ectothiorhodospira marina]